MSEYKSLNSIEIIRTRPGQFIGDRSTPTHLLTEIVDNALDEIKNKYGTECQITFNDDRSCWITDNGRGLKIYNMTLHDGSITDSIIALCTTLYTGSKFDTKDYNNLIGMHGAGLVLVNALSEWFVVCTFREDIENRYTVYIDDRKFTFYEI